MMKHFRNVCIGLAAGILTVTVVMTDNMFIYSKADKATEAETISAAEARRQKLQDKKQDLQETLSELENDKKDVLDYIEKADKKLNN